MLPSPATIRWSSSSSLIACRRPRSALQQIFGGKTWAERLRPHRGECGPGIEHRRRGQGHETEAARIGQRKKVVRRLEQEMIVLPDRFGIDPPAPAHAEVEDHGLLTLGMHEAVLRAPPQPGDACAGQRLDKVGRKGNAHVGAVEHGASDPRPVKVPGETAHRRLDLGEFGHGGHLGIIVVAVIAQPDIASLTSPSGFGAARGAA